MQDGGFRQEGRQGASGWGLFGFLCLVFFFYERAQTLDALERDIVFFHQFFQVVPFFRNEVPVTVRFRQPDDVTAHDSVNGVEFHDAVFAEVGDVRFVFDEFFPFVQMIVHMTSLRWRRFFGGTARFFSVKMLKAGVGAFIEKPVDGSQTLAFFRGQPPFCFNRQIEHDADDFAGIDDQRQMIDV